MSRTQSKTTIFIGSLVGVSFLHLSILPGEVVAKIWKMWLRVWILLSRRASKRHLHPIERKTSQENGSLIYDFEDSCSNGSDGRRKAGKALATILKSPEPKSKHTEPSFHKIIQQCFPAKKKVISTFTWVNYSIIKTIKQCKEYLVCQFRVKKTSSAQIYRKSTLYFHVSLSE